MRIPGRSIAPIAVVLLLMAPGLSYKAKAAQARAYGVRAVHPSSAAALSRAVSRVPVGFELNVGQAAPGVRYVARLPHANLSLSSAHIVLSMQEPSVSSTAKALPVVHMLRARIAASSRPPALPAGAVVDLRPVGANPRARMVPLDRLPEHVNYFVGPSPRNWHTNVPVYARIEYRNIYPHIDLLFYGRGGAVEYDWIVHPGARISSARLKISGGPTGIGPDGTLRIHTAAGDVLQAEPRMYQRVGRTLRRVRGGYTRARSGSIGFWVGPHDAHRTLVIDPVLQYSTYLGGSGSDWEADVALNSRGDAYIVGSTISPDFPLVHPIPGQHANAQEDAIVSELNPTGTGLIYSTYLGGEGVDDGVGIALDRSGHAYVTGFTRSVGFPAVHALPGSRCNPDQFKSGDAFVAELSPGGNALLFSTCLGGSGTDWASGIGADASGAIYVCGGTASDTFPTSSPLQAKRAGGSDAFLSKFVQGRLTFSTYLGGSNDDTCGGVAVDAANNVFLTGTTDSVDFPLKNGLQSHYGGGSQDGEGSGDAFVTEISQHEQVVYSTYLGGHDDDGASAIAVDAGGSAYVAGLTQSSDFPTASPAQATLGGGIDAFVARLAPGGSRLIYSTFLGGDGRDAATGIAVDALGNAYIAGTTASTNFPVVAPIQATGAFGDPYEDVFVARLDAAGGTTFATYLGGTGVDIASGIAVDGQGGVYLTGGTSSTDFPITVGLAGTSPDRGNGFIVKIETGDTGGSVAVDGLGLFRANKRGIEVPAQVAPSGGKVLFISLYHTTGVDAAAVHATIRFTAGGRTIVTRAMKRAVSVDRRPMFSLSWHVPGNIRGTVTAHVQLSVGGSIATRTLKFKITAGAT